MDRLPALLALVALAALAGNARAQQDAEALADKYNCSMCHRVDERRVGPAFRDVARRYKDDPQAMERLAKKVRRGGNGNWGSVSMPANDVSESDLRALLRWVLGSA
ncbi:MAG TPA: c-type cytochrome [Usitatibacter sp.]|nr:c-type cytochrome [Usitatibacter sp.]